MGYWLTSFSSRGGGSIFSSFSSYDEPLGVSSAMNASFSINSTASDALGRERMYVNATRMYWVEAAGRQEKARVSAMLSAMKRISAAFPSDLDAACLSAWLEVELTQPFNPVVNGSSSAASAAAVEEALKNGPAHPGCLLFGALAYLASGDAEKAAALAARLTASAPDGPEGMMALARAHVVLGRWKDCADWALKAYRKSSEVQRSAGFPVHQRLWDGVVVGHYAMLQMGRRTAAAALLTEIRALVSPIQSPHPLVLGAYYQLTAQAALELLDLASMHPFDLPAGVALPAWLTSSTALVTDPARWSSMVPRSVLDLDSAMVARLWMTGKAVAYGRSPGSLDEVADRLYNASLDRVYTVARLGEVASLMVRGEAYSGLVDGRGPYSNSTSIETSRLYLEAAVRLARGYVTGNKAHLLPSPPSPPQERLGEFLLKHYNGTELHPVAADLFREALALHPNRLRSLMGLARSYRKLNVSLAVKAYDQILAQLGNTEDYGLPERAEASAYLSVFNTPKKVVKNKSTMVMLIMLGILAAGLALLATATVARYREKSEAREDDSSRLELKYAVEQASRLVRAPELGTIQAGPSSNFQGRGAGIVDDPDEPYV
jgi:hypothetical protein